MSFVISMACCALLTFCGDNVNVYSINSHQPVPAKNSCLIIALVVLAPKNPQ